MKTARKTVSIILWVFAVLFLAYTVWAIIQSASTVSSAVAGGQVVGGFTYTIISYYMASCAPYFAYALLFGAGGLLLWGHKKSRPAEVAEVITITEVEEPDVVDAAEDVKAETAEQTEAVADKAAEAEAEVKAEVEAVTQE